MRRDYYEVLGVGRDADEAAVKKAFRRLAREMHPDVSPPTYQNDAVLTYDPIHQVVLVRNKNYRRDVYPGLPKPDPADPADVQRLVELGVPAERVGDVQDCVARWQAPLLWSTGEGGSDANAGRGGWGGGGGAQASAALHRSSA